MQALPTEDEIRKVREVGGIEFVRGKLVNKIKSMRTCEVISQVRSLLEDESSKTRDTFVFSSKLGYQCSPDDPAGFRKPDLSVMRHERMTNLDRNAPLVPIPPDLAVEVISYHELANDLDERIDDYLRSGFRLVWVISQQTRTAMIYRQDGSVTRLHENNEITGELVLPTFRCKVREFFRALAPRWA